MPAKATDIRAGMAVIYNDQLHVVLDTEHVKPGTWLFDLGRPA